MRPEPLRVLFVFAWLVVGGEETEVRLLARTLDPALVKLDVIVCFHKEGMPDQSHRQLEALGVDVDTTPYGLSFDDTVSYLADRVAGYDVVVSCQNVADIYPALERLHWRPPLIEHGGLVSEAQAGPKHFTSRYVGVCDAIRDAAAARMHGRDHHAVTIPSMVDLAEFSPGDRAATRAFWGIGPDVPVIGWVGRLDQKKRVEDVIAAAALVISRRPDALFKIIGGPDAFMPDYADKLRQDVIDRGLADSIAFLGDRPDVPKLLAGLDVFCWLSENEGMPHVIAEAGAAGLAVVATPDNGALEQIEHGVSGLFVPYRAPGAVADAVVTLLNDPGLRQRLGRTLRQTVEARFSADVIVPQWLALLSEVVAEHRPAPPPCLFKSWFHGGFECSTHRLRGGRRLDVIAATGHDVHALADYRSLGADGLLTVRDGVRWHLIEPMPGGRDWSSFLPMLRMARTAGTQVIWDLMHYGWPDDIDIWSPQFGERFAAFARDVATLVRAEGPEVPFYCPVNEISFFSWGGGDAGYLNPFANGRGFELKCQLARASIMAMEAILKVDPRARFIHADPVIHIDHDPARPWTRQGASGHRLAQFQSWDMIAGRIWPQLGGRPALLDIVGVNYYFNNQWIHEGSPIDEGHPAYKPFRLILAETYARYGRPLFVAETGIEGDRRPPWLAMICREVAAARAMGVPVEAICLYPVLNHPGWDDDRDCRNGLYSRNLTSGQLDRYEPLATMLGANLPSI
jgi:glycosyltransferase involved in cell wall biosynthesis